MRGSGCLFAAPACDASNITNLHAWIYNQGSEGNDTSGTWASNPCYQELATICQSYKNVYSGVSYATPEECAWHWLNDVIKSLDSSSS